jgi:hypothetical protein
MRVFPARSHGAVIDIQSRTATVAGFKATWEISME